MRPTLKSVVITAALLTGASSAAMAQCPPGYGFYGGVCRPMGSPGYSNPVSGAASGEAAGAASGYRAAGPVGAVVGGALGTAAGTVSGTANMVTGGPQPACGYGYQYYNGYCYPGR